MSSYAVEVVLHWIAVGTYILATALFVHAAVFGHPQRLRWGVWATAGGLVPHAAALLLRWTSSGHGPYMARYEVLSSTTFIAVVVLVAFLARRPAWGALGAVVLPVAFLALALSMFMNPQVRELPPSLRSVWLVFHVLCGKLSAGAFLLSAGTATLQLAQPRRQRWRWLSALPAYDELEAFTFRFIGFGFIFWSITIAAGAIWANQSWGRYWGWDPIETWSLISWLAYGSYLHARLLFRLRARASAGLALASFAVFSLAAFFIPARVASIHSSYFQ